MPQNKNRFPSSLKKISVKDLDLIYIWCNEHFARDLGLSPQEIYGKSDLTLFPKNVAVKTQTDDRTVIRSGYTQDYEEKVGFEGSNAWVHIIKTPTRDKTGKINGVLTITSDITFQKNTQGELLQTEERSKLVERYGKIGYWEVDVTTGEMFWSDGLFQVLQKDKTSISSNIDNFLNFFIKEDNEKLKKALTLVTNTGELVELDLLAHISDTTVLNLYVTIHSIKDSGGKVTNLFGTVQDISLIKSSENKFKTLFNSNDSAILIHDIHGSIVDANLASEVLFELSREDLLVTSLFSLFSSPAVDVLREFFQKINNETVTEYSGISANKKLVEIKSIEVILDNTPYIMTIVQDVTFQKTRETELRAREKDLSSKIKELERLNALMVNRELKMTELKNENKRLKGNKR